jgi:hypothetical protein
MEPQRTITLTLYIVLFSNFSLGTVILGLNAPLGQDALNICRVEVEVSKLVNQLFSRFSLVFLVISFLMFFGRDYNLFYLKSLI